MSIYNGLKAAEEVYGVDDNIVLIHDGVRPLINEQIITDNIECVKEKWCSDHISTRKRDICTYR